MDAAQQIIYYEHIYTLKLSLAQHKTKQKINEKETAMKTVSRRNLKKNF